MRHLLCVAVASAMAIGADTDRSYEPGSRLVLVFTSGVKCDSRVVERAGQRVTVVPARQQPLCPNWATVLDLGSVVAVRGHPSLARRAMGAGVMAMGLVGGPAIGFGLGSESLGVLTTVGTVATGAFIGQSGYKWTVFLNQSQLEAAP